MTGKAQQPHRIRLREPWERLTVPGRRCFVRRFGIPTGIVQTDRIDLVLDHVAVPMAVILNEEVLGEALPGPDSARFSLRERLLARNTLTIEVDLTRTPSIAVEDSHRLFPNLIGEIRLEISSQSG